MAAPKQAARKPRRRDRKSIPVGQAHIKSTFNNTIISITDPSGAVVSWASGGDVGFKGSSKSTQYAAGMAAESATRKAMEHGVIVRAIANCIALCPPLISERQHIDELVDGLTRAVDAAQVQFGASLATS